MKKLRELELKACPDYDPEGLLKHLAEHLNTGSDYELAQVLELPAPTISKIRNFRTNMTAGVLLRMHDVTGLPVDTLRNWMGVPSYAAQVHFEPVD